MKTYLDCIPCFLRQTISAGRMTMPDETHVGALTRAVLKEIAEMDMRSSPPVMGRFIHRKIKEFSGTDDPYAEIKQQSNEAAMRMIGEFERLVASAADPLELAVRLSVAGNIIDHGAGTAPDLDDLKEQILSSLTARFYGDIDEFRYQVENASRILFIADNAGEIVFDRVLIQRLPLDKLTVAVRGRPVINDALYEDADIAGLTQIVPVVDTGSDVPGVILQDCSSEFQDIFQSADLIISKGQGNFETLSDILKPIFFLLKVKCQVVARHLNIPEGAMALVSPGQTV